MNISRLFSRQFRDSIPDTCQVLYDTREQKICKIPGAVEKMQKTGDYSVAGLEGIVGIERKSGCDFLGSCGKGHDRLNREMERASKILDFIFLVEVDPEIFLNPRQVEDRKHDDAGNLILDKKGQAKIERWWSYAWTAETPKWKRRLSKMNPATLRGVLEKWPEKYGIRWVFVDSFEEGQRFIERQAYHWWKTLRAGEWAAKTDLFLESEKRK